MLSHYRPQGHLVVDKYEQAPGVLNRDVLELGELGEFELVVAISTLEHVGLGRGAAPAGGRARGACRALRERLAPGGRLVITHPVGYNPDLDEALRSGARPAHASGGAAARGPKDALGAGAARGGVARPVRLPALLRPRGRVR